MARNAVGSSALTFLVVASVAPALAVGGSLRGEVMERQRADGSRSLGVSIEREQIEALPTVARSFDELILTMPKAAARDLEVAYAPEGWRLDDSFRRGLRVYGPQVDVADFRFDGPRSWRPPAEVGVDCRLDGQSVFSGELPVRQRPRVRPSDDYREWLELPTTLQVGSPFRIESLARDKLKLGLRWDLRSDDPYLDFGFRSEGDYRIGVVPNVYAPDGWDPHYDSYWPWEREYEVIGRDRWNETWVRDTWKPIFIPGTDIVLPPLFDGATEIVAPNSQLCICGQTSDLSDWNRFAIGGVPLGAPIVATGASATFALPQGLPPGQQPIEFEPWREDGRSTGLETAKITVQGGIQKDVIREGERTNLVLEVIGTDRSFPVTLENRTPRVIDLVGSSANKVETRTSGGAPGSPNVMTHPVVGIEGTVQGNPFKVLYRVDLPQCPCDAQNEQIADAVGDEFVELLEGWDSELKGDSTGAPATKQELFDSVDRLWLNDRWRLNDRWSFNLGFRYDEVGSEGGTAAALPKPLAEAGCRPAGDAPLTLLNNRFQVRVDWSSKTPAQAAVCPQPDRDDSGLFYYLSPENWAVMVKVLDACDRFDRYWVFSTATAQVAYTIQLTDTKSGENRRYESTAGNAFQPVLDTQAFATCP
jgi:hypothetical protein